MRNKCLMCLRLFTGDTHYCSPNCEDRARPPDERSLAQAKGVGAIVSSKVRAPAYKSALGMCVWCGVKPPMVYIPGTPGPIPKYCSKRCREAACHAKKKARRNV